MSRRQLKHLAEVAAQRAAQELAAGVAETVALERARGVAITTEGRQTRRLTGLEWLQRRDQLSTTQVRMGQLYGRLWRMAHEPASLPSALREPAGRYVADTLQLSEADRRLWAQARLDALRQDLRSRALIEACDLICGQELTPRQATANGRDSNTLTALLQAALDILTKD